MYHYWGASVLYVLLLLGIVHFFTQQIFVNKTTALIININNTATILSWVKYCDEGKNILFSMLLFSTDWHHWHICWLSQELWIFNILHNQQSPLRQLMRPWTDQWQPQKSSRPAVSILKILMDKCLPWDLFELDDIQNSGGKSYLYQLDWPQQSEMLICSMSRRLHNLFISGVRTVYFVRY